MTKSKLNILFISPIIPIPANDGGKLSLFGLLKGLASNGHKIDFFCYLQNKDYDKSIDTLSKYCKPFIILHSTENKISKAIINFFNPLPYNLTKYLSSDLKKELKKYFEENTPDVIHVATLSMAWVVDEIKKYSNAPIVLRQENFESMIFKRRFERERSFVLKHYLKYQYKKYIKYEPEICGKFNKCIMISNVDTKRLLELNNRIRTVSIPVGVDEIANNYDSNVEPYSLVHIGSLNWYPNKDGIEWFINYVFTLVVAKYPEAKLYLYGGGINNDFKISGKLKNNIVIKGFVENIWQELASKSIGIIPLRIGGGIRVKILEMMSFGIPLVTTEIGKEGIDAEPNKHLLVANTPKEFTDSIEKIWLDESVGKYLTQNSKKKINEKYTWSAVIKKFETTYFEQLKSNQKNSRLN
ncbi:MAG: glycosyltransferase [Ignavibacteriae bacterium]|nr:glycosyltransferase [Ignavibacteriota bacterium]NOG97546.1 glycosyltransferase [Ignavibacteriota bacterium]